MTSLGFSRYTGGIWMSLLTTEGSQKDSHPLPMKRSPVFDATLRDTGPMHDNWLVAAFLVVHCALFPYKPYAPSCLRLL